VAAVASSDVSGPNKGATRRRAYPGAAGRMPATMPSRSAVGCALQAWVSERG